MADFWAKNAPAATDEGGRQDGDGTRSKTAGVDEEQDRILAGNSDDDVDDEGGGEGGDDAG